MALGLDTNIVIVAVVFSAAALLAVVLRIYSRLRQQRTGLGIDDILIIPGVLCAIGVGIANVVAATDGRLGQHMQYGPDGPIRGQYLVTMEKVSTLSNT